MHPNRVRSTRLLRLTGTLACAGTLAMTGCTVVTEEEPGVLGQEPSVGASDLPDEAGDEAGGGDGGAAVSGAACLAAVTWRGTLYVQVDAEPVQRGRALDGAEVPPCNDTGTTTEVAQPIDAFAVEGVHPAYAVMSTSPGGHFVYVAEEYVPGRTDAEPLPQRVSTRLGLR